MSTAKQSFTPVSIFNDNWLRDCQSKGFHWLDRDTVDGRPYLRLNIGDRDAQDIGIDINQAADGGQPIQTEDGTPLNIFYFPESSYTHPGSRQPRHVPASFQIHISRVCTSASGFVTRGQEHFTAHPSDDAR